MAADNNRGIAVRISKDDMEAYVTLPVIGRGERYTRDEVIEALAQAKVKVGIKESVIDEMIATEAYGREKLVAQGTISEDGQDAYYEYMFKTKLDKKPEIRQDGTVDYWSIQAIEIVDEGQIIAIYHEPVDGHHGMTVSGKLIMAKRGRPLPPLIGKGFEKAEDGITYTASITGKIDIKDNRIQILPIYELKNVDLSTGNVDFRGDVVVHGNVVSGMSIKATGSVTIDGTAEACTIEAGKDVILRGGFLGGYKGIIRTKGNVYAKFIEYATIVADGFMEANSTLSSDIYCKDKVFITGKRSAIIGGTVYGARGVEAYNLGNVNEIRTVVRSGVLRETLVEVELLKKKLNEDNVTMQKINDGLQQFDQIAAEKNIDLRNDKRRVALLRARIAKQADIASTRERLDQMRVLIENTKGATIRVVQDVFPGVDISINEILVRVREQQNAVQYELRDEQLVMYSVKGGVVG